MKYKEEIDIKRPIDAVVALFDDPGNLKEWMDGFQGLTHLEGVPGERGAKSALRFRQGKRTIEMVETILIRNLPEEFTATYTAKGVNNISTNRFIPLPDNRTRFVSEQEFIFSGFMKLIGLVFARAFKRQTLRHLNSFKRFAETRLPAQ